VSHLGQKRRFRRLLGMSAFPPIVTELLHHTKVVWRIGYVARKVASGRD
jgi:hypothetical protein